MLIPWREDLEQSTALILTLPVLVVAVLGGAGPGVLSAVVAGVCFDFALTIPYHQLAIRDNDDMVALVVLVSVGVAVGLLARGLTGARSRADVRLEELDHVFAFTRQAIGAATPDDVIEAARRHFEQVLGLADAEWRPIAREVEEPLMLADGHVMGLVTKLPQDRAELASGTQVPVCSGSSELGHFVLRPSAGHVVSLEERRVASTIAGVLGLTLARMAAEGG